MSVSVVSCQWSVSEGRANSRVFKTVLVVVWFPIFGRRKGKEVHGRPFRAVRQTHRWGGNTETRTKMEGKASSDFLRWQLTLATASTENDF